MPDISIPSELVTRATAELDEQVRRELEIADPATHVAIAILTNTDSDSEEDNGDKV